MLKKLLIFVAFIVSFTACTKSTNDPVAVNTNADVIIINEGNFSSADGSLSTFRSSDNTSELGIFERVNGFPLAATLQTAFTDNTRQMLFITTNAPDKLEIVSLNNFASLGSIRNTTGNTNFTNPYTFVRFNNVGYVSNWGTWNNTTFSYENGFLTKINLDNNSVITKISRTKQPQDLLVFNNNLYVTNVDGNTISVLSTNNESSIAEITTPTGPDKMILDRNNKIWVLCTSGKLIRINPTNNTIEQTFDVSVQGYNEKMVMNGNKDVLYWISSTGFNPAQGKVFSMNINATTAPTTPLISRNNIYGVGVHPVSGDIYVGDSNSFQGNGRVYVYNPQGTEKTNFNVGRGPNGFVFR
jgi:YVTN family beta-propeller protein